MRTAAVGDLLMHDRETGCPTVLLDSYDSEAEKYDRKLSWIRRAFNPSSVSEGDLIAPGIERQRHGEIFQLIDAGELEVR